ncbi:MAG: hypothetical protein IAF94_11585, partial [Pirellulaceae bacterium]|nr:hypothetical protein [Pirellulaceae bacterium]
MLLATLPMAAAEGFQAQRATASALRWGLAVALAIGAVPLCFRQQLAVV